ncbi:MAG: riboflavin synthase [Burkholderiaceae bacterium]|nr:riboflavin synthase [Burkholderiaceae bacterium]
MFTGIITGVGRIVAVHASSSLSPSATSSEGGQPSVPTPFGNRLCIEAPSGYLDDVGLGDSIALNGACMTVNQLDMPKSQFWIDISAESLEKTAGLAQPGPINLEKALRAHDRLGGHLVSGHVDGVGKISFFAPVGESWELRIMAPPELGKFLAYKGSITVNGVSLTVNRVTDSAAGTELSINLIPHTVENTALGSLGAGSDVNLEIDLIARYVERMLSHTAIPSAAPKTALFN